MYTRILLAADGSENSLRAAREAVRIAALGQSGSSNASADVSIEAVYVVDSDTSTRDVIRTRDENELRLYRIEKIRPLEQLLRQTGVEYSVKMLHGEPGPAIVEHAKQSGADLIVIGSRGLNALQEMMLGSVSHKVVKRAHCPVLIVK